MIKVGDMVKVVNWGDGYSYYKDFFEDNGRQDLKKRFQDNITANYGTTGIVVFEGRHRHSGHKILAVDIEQEDRVILIGEKGLEVITPSLRSGMILVLTDGDEGIIIEFNGELVFMSKNGCKRVSFIQDSIKVLKRPLDLLALSEYVKGKEYNYQVIFDYGARKLEDRVEKLKAKLEEAKKDLKIYKGTI